MSGSAERRKVRLIIREIIFQEFQPVWSQYTNVMHQRYRRMDGQTTYHGNTALRYASRGKNWKYYKLPEILAENSVIPGPGGLIID